tara:strand:+ start:559 stop:1245 length:687 start_codon:yes stop_codon:yes gene_type:complete
MLKKNRTKIISIILARGGSKQIKNKNLIKINNKPLIFYTIKECLRSNLINETWVSSDNENILKYSKKIGAKVIKRPKIFSKDNTSSESSWYHAINYLKKKVNFEIVVAPQVTSPKRPKHVFDRAIKYFKRKNLDSLMSVSEINPPNMWVKLKNSDKLKIKNHNLYRGRQSFQKTFNENGSFYIFKASEFLKFKNRLFKKIGAYKIDKKFSFEIDDLDDLKIIKRLFNL